MSASTTLHHPSCGCAGTLGSPEADADAAASAAAAQIADSLVSNYQQLLGRGVFKADRRLRVAYIIPHHKLTGGLKVLCMHMQLLRQRGHYVVAVHRMGAAAASHARFHAGESAAPAEPPRALPPWSSVEVDEEVVLGPEQHLAARYPTQTLDAIVCGMFQQVPELLVGLPDSSSVAVIYYEQGHEFLFGDPLRSQHSSGYSAADRIFHMVMGLPVVLACVSEPVRELVAREFGRGRAMTVPNGVDTDAFRPAWGMTHMDHGAVGGAGSHSRQQQQQQPRRSAHPVTASSSSCTAGLRAGGEEGSSWPWVASGLPPPSRMICQKQVLPECSRPCLLLVGDPGLQLKGFDVAVRVLQLVVRALQQQQLSQQQQQQQQQQLSQQQQARLVTAGQGQLGLPLLVTWVCQRMPGQELLDAVSAAGEDLVLGLYIQAPQELLPLLYRSHSALLFTSQYEAWGMPVLEALACGLAVITTACSGVLSFTHPGEDCLVAAVGDVPGLARHVLAVLLDPVLRARLQQQGRATACQHSLAAVLIRLEELLYSSVAAAAELQRLRSHPLCQATARRAAAACIAAIEGAARTHEQMLEEQP